MTNDEKRLELMNFARGLGATLSEHGEIGFGRPCIGLLYGSSYLAYHPSLHNDNFTPLRDLWDDDVNPPDTVPDAYHKDDYMAVLIHDDDRDEALDQLYKWMKNIESKGGARLVHFRTMATGMQAVISGLSAAAIVTRPFYDDLCARQDSLHEAIGNAQFQRETDVLEAETIE